jgi:hypothetical protein
MAYVMPKKRWVSFFEIYGTPEGDGARLGTGIYEDVVARNVDAPRITCFFSHATDAYLSGFARFSLARWDKSKNDFVSEYPDEFERIGGPMWLVGIFDGLVAQALACLHREPFLSEEGRWIRAVIDQPLCLIASPRALAELSGEEPLGEELVMHLFIQGSLMDIETLSQGTQPHA